MTSFAKLCFYGLYYMRMVMFDLINILIPLVRPKLNKNLEIT